MEIRGEGTGVRLTVFALCALAATSGCSWIFVQPLPDRYEYPDCTTSRVAPAIDTIFTLTNLGSVVYVAGEDNVTNKGTAVAVGLAVATIWATSAIYGYSQTSQCDDAKDEYTQPYRPPPLHLRSPPRYYPPAPPAEPVPAAPAPAAATPVAPPGAVARPDGATPAPAPYEPPGVVPQQQDDDDPAANLGRQRRRPPPPPAPKLDQPHFGN